jgi:hypothetical protein
MMVPGSLETRCRRLRREGSLGKHQPYERVRIARTERSPGGENQAIRLISGGQVVSPLLQTVLWGTREYGGANHRTLRETVSDTVRLAVVAELRIPHPSGVDVPTYWPQPSERDCDEHKHLEK